MTITARYPLARHTSASAGARAASRVLDDGVAGRKQPVAFRTLDHRQRHPVLHGTCRIPILQLHPQLRAVSWCAPTEAEQWRLSDRRRDRLHTAIVSGQPGQSNGPSRTAASHKGSRRLHPARAGASFGTEPLRLAVPARTGDLLLVRANTMADVPLRKRSRRDGRCPARTGDLLLVRREQSAAVYCRLSLKRLVTGGSPHSCCRLLHFVASKALPYQRSWLLSPRTRSQVSDRQRSRTPSRR
jgi:hypothetical protein